MPPPPSLPRHSPCWPTPAHGLGGPPQPPSFELPLMTAENPGASRNEPSRLTPRWIACGATFCEWLACAGRYVVNDAAYVSRIWLLMVRNASERSGSQLPDSSGCMRSAVV